MERTVAEELRERYPGIKLEILRPRRLPLPAAGLGVEVVSPRGTGFDALPGIPLPAKGDWFAFHVDDRGAGRMLASRASFLYAGWTRLLDRVGEDLSGICPLVLRFAFSSQRSVFDLFLNQYARRLRGFDPDSYIREYARLGFSHIEVNGLAAPHPLEQGVEGEFYPEFYTYGPALDQFAASRLNRGLYPEAALNANRDRLINNARTALRFGLTPGLLCFEPRSVPDSFFEKFPTLRGARVDHPFRSFKPRYNMSIAHPVVLDHYGELLVNLLERVPELDHLAIWTNDSGAGFEFTQSLYVGRNGGAYIIREWKSGEDIARAAAENTLRFLRRLRDAGRSVNPRFRVLTRIEPFYGEMDYLWPGLEDGLEVEAHSLTARGWESNYPHPAYPEIPVLGSALHNFLREEEKDLRGQLAARGSENHFYHTLGSHANHEPLLGIPFPWLTWEKLKSAHGLGVPALAHLGGIQPPGHVPYAVNQEVFRLFQMDPGMDIEAALDEIAGKWVGGDRAADLVAGWRLVDDAVRRQPPMSLYSGFGVVWQRLLVRPLVPDIDRIPEDERRYYERFMCTSIHNPNRVDLAKDVLFELISPSHAAWARSRFDGEVRPRLESAREELERSADNARRAGEEKTAGVFADQAWRVRALMSMCETLRNTAMWIDRVHAYPGADRAGRSRIRRDLNEMMDREIANARELMEIWDNGPVEWMIISAEGETPFIYGADMGMNLQRKIDLMMKYRDAEPFIDPDYMFRVDGGPDRR